jgi:uncharacterized protein (TIGR01777 family)
MRIAISGSTGLVGSALVRFFRGRGVEVTRIVRSYAGLPPQERAVVWNPVEGTIEADALRGHDVVIHLAGESIGGVWTPGRKRRIRSSRINGTALLSRTLAALPERPGVLLSASGMGFYGTASVSVDETSPVGAGFLADVGQAWEAATAPAEQSGIRVVHMRFANILSPDGGALATFLPIFRLGLGARFGSGDQCWPWVSLLEIPHVVTHLLDHRELTGPVNVVAPQRTTNADLTREIAKAVHRPAIMAVPSFVARLAPGHMGEEILLGGACMEPRKLQQSGYTFRHPALAPALRELLRG